MFHDQIYFLVLPTVPPEVKQTSGPRLIKSVGEDEVKLQCNVKYAQTYTWFKNGARISSISPKRYNVKQYRYLQITNVMKSDSGLFVCVAKNNIGRVNCTINFLVEGMDFVLFLDSTLEIVAISFFNSL